MFLDEDFSRSKQQGSDLMSEKMGRKRTFQMEQYQAMKKGALNVVLLGAAGSCCFSSNESTLRPSVGAGDDDDDDE